VVELVLPPLRARAGDIPLLVTHFLGRYWKRAEERPHWTARAERALGAYAYPGNVRELAHIVERASILAMEPELDIDLFPAELKTAEVQVTSSGFSEYTQVEREAARTAAQEQVDVIFLKGLMDRHQGNISLAARTSGIHRGQLHKLLARYGIKHS
jgi:DNA-binding NtrC family response regulator